MRDRIALWLIVLAQKLTTWGMVYDHLDLAKNFLVRMTNFPELDWDYLDTSESKTSINSTKKDG